LVTDLPADFEVFGQAVDTSMADLKGGTTGQILSKATNADMDFTWIANDQGDITGVTATSPLTGGGTSGAITVGIQDATTSVKGSVQLSDSTSTTSSVLAATPTAVKSAYDLAALASPAAAAFYAGKNRQLNSNFSVWQRGTSFTGNGAANTYSADRWKYYNNGTSLTITRQATGDTTNLPNIQYCMRVARNNASTNTNSNYLEQSFETVNSIPLAGKTITLSFYARKGANYSTASSNLYAEVHSGTGTDQSWLTGYTGDVTVISQAAVLTGTWQRFSYSGTLNTTITEMAVVFASVPVGTAGAADYFEVTGVQVEVGSTASPYAPNGANYQAELAACQRYYFATQTGTSTYIGYAYALNGTIYDIPFPVSMRTNPTALVTSGTSSAYALNASTSITPTFDKAGVNTAQILGAITITAGQGSRIECGANSIAFSAEL
jgi:hypothetical protein